MGVIYTRKVLLIYIFKEPLQKLFALLEFNKVISVPTQIKVPNYKLSVKD